MSEHENSGPWPDARAAETFPEVEAALLTKGEIAARRQEILEALAAGRMDAAEAATQIRQLGKGV